MLLYIILSFLYIAILFLKKRASILRVLPVLLLFMLFLTVRMKLFIRPHIEEMFFIDSSKSMSAQDNSDLKKEKYHTIEERRIRNFSGFNYHSSPINETMKILTGLSLLSGKKIHYMSDFNYSDDTPERYGTDINIMPLKNTYENRNAGIISVNPRSTFWDSRNRLNIGIFSTHNREIELSILTNDDEIFSKHFKLKSGLNTIFADISLALPGVYPVHIKIEADDDVKADDNFHFDLVLKKRRPEILFIYKFPSKDIGIISRILNEFGCNVSVVHNSRIDDTGKFDGYVLYNTEYDPGGKPVLIIGADGKKDLEIVNQRGLNYLGNFPGIMIRSQIKQGIILDKDNAGNGFIGYNEGRYFITILRYYPYFLVENNKFSGVFKKIIHKFHSDMVSYANLNLRGDRVLTKMDNEFIFSEHIRSVTINGKEIPSVNEGFIFRPVNEKHISIKINYENNNAIRTYQRVLRVYENDLENALFGFNAEKYERTISNYKFFEKQHLLKRQAKSINPFETVFAFILILFLFFLIFKETF